MTSAACIDARKIALGVTGPLAAPWFSDQRARAVIDAAIVSGIRCFDTGAFYGGGLGERRLASALRQNSVSATIMTKTGKRLGRGGRLYPDYAPESIRQDVENSLARFKLERLDFVYLHGPSDIEAASGLETLNRLREEGKLASIGICTTFDNLETAIALDVDGLMCAFNFLDARAVANLRKAKRKGIHIAAIAPLAQGVYEAGFSTNFAVSDMWKRLRARRNTPQLAKNARLIRQKMERATQVRPLSAAALSFVVMQEFVDVAVFTTTKSRRISPLARAQLLSAEEVSRLGDINRELSLFKSSV